MKNFYLFLLLFISGLGSTNAQIRSTSTNVNVFGDTVINYSDGSSVKRSTNIFGDKIVTVTDSDKSETEILTNSFGNTTKKATTPDGRTIQSHAYSKEVNVFGDNIIRYSDGTSVKTSKDIFGDKTITVTRNGKTLKTIKVSKDISGSEIQTVTKANDE